MAKPEPTKGKSTKRRCWLNYCQTFPFNLCIIQLLANPPATVKGIQAMEKCAKAFVEKQIENLNKLTKMPLQPYHCNEQQVIAPQAGSYHLDNAYGAYCLVRMSETIGCTGTSQVGNMGYVSLRMLSNYIRMFSEGYQAASTNKAF